MARAKKPGKKGRNKRNISKTLKRIAENNAILKLFKDNK
jgi:hypothetical protein